MEDQNENVEEQAALMSDQEGLMETSFLIQTIALRGTDEERCILADVVSGMPPDIVLKYWEDAQAFKLAMAKIMTLTPVESLINGSDDLF